MVFFADYGFLNTFNLLFLGFKSDFDFFYKFSSKCPFLALDSSYIRFLEEVFFFFFVYGFVFACDRVESVVAV